jgi:hypothetical protein
MDEAFLNRGKIQFDKAIRLYKECLESGIWPEYTSKEVVTLSMPHYLEEVEF